MQCPEARLSQVGNYVSATRSLVFKLPRYRSADELGLKGFGGEVDDQVQHFFDVGFTTTLMGSHYTRVRRGHKYNQSHMSITVRWEGRY